MRFCFAMSVGLLLIAAAAPATAEIVRVTWTGSIAFNFGVPGLPTSGPASGSFEYDTATPPTAYFGRTIYDVNTTFHFTFGGLSGSASNQDIQIHNDVPSTLWDGFRIRSAQSVNGPPQVFSGPASNPSPGWTVDGFDFELTDDEGLIFSSESLPNSLSLAGWDGSAALGGTRVIFVYTDGNVGANFIIEFDSISSEIVAPPAVPSIGAVGMGALSILLVSVGLIVSSRRFATR